MSSFQKIVKFIGIGFAVLLSVTIIGGICAAIFGVSVSVDGGKNSENAVSQKFSFDEFSSIDIDTSVADVVIKTGEKYEVETVEVPESMEVKVAGNDKLTISEDSHDGWFSWTFWMNKKNWNKQSKVYITVPEGYEADNVVISAGTGNVSMSDFNIRKLEVDGGVGNISGNNLKVDDVDIDAGVGNVDYDDVEFGKCEVESGVGNVNISGTLNGHCEFDGGVGDLDLTIIGSRSDYDLDIDSGAGSVRVNGRKVEELEENNGSDNKIVIDGGVGSVSLEFTQD